MPERDLETSRASASTSGHYCTADDIKLPSLEPNSTAEANESEVPNPFGAISQGRLLAIFCAVALMAALSWGSIGAWFGASAREDHPNWQHVASATAASEESPAVVHIAPGATAKTTDAVVVTGADADRSASRRLQIALSRQDFAAANQVWKEAQKYPSAFQGEVELHNLSANSQLTTALASGDSELYQLFVADCCHEDGDRVEVLVNGESMGTIPLTHEGITLSIPLARGSNQVTLRGVHDGGGGITTLLRSSRGDFFCRSIQTGESIPLKVVVK